MLVEYEVRDGPRNVEAVGRIAGHVGRGPPSTPTVCRALRKDREHSVEVRLLRLDGGAFDVHRIGGPLGNSRVELAYASTAPESILTGARAVHQRLTDLLQAQGVVPYTSAGEPFDVTLHDAVDAIKTDRGTVGSCARRTAPRVSVGR